VLTLGEGWHNNHHRYRSSARQGIRWWEIDVSYYLIRLLAFVGLIWDVRQPPQTKVLHDTVPFSNSTAAPTDIL
jgi:stearoyl-CoA desaturase (delta-9 desaturase)